MTRRLAALLLLASAVAASAEPVADGFEAETLGSLWDTRFVTPGRVTVQRDFVRSGAADVDFRFGLYRDRMTAPMVIYFDDYRKEHLPQ